MCPAPGHRTGEKGQAPSGHPRIPVSPYMRILETRIFPAFAFERMIPLTLPLTCGLYPHTFSHWLLTSVPHGVGWLEGHGSEGHPALSTYLHGLSGRLGVCRSWGARGCCG